MSEDGPALQTVDGEFAVLVAGRRAGKTALVDALLRALDATGLDQPLLPTRETLTTRRKVRGGARIAFLDTPHAAPPADLIALVELHLRRSATTVCGTLFLSSWSLADRSRSAGATTLSICEIHALTSQFEY